MPIGRSCCALGPCTNHALCRPPAPVVSQCYPAHGSSGLLQIAANGTGSYWPCVQTASSVPQEHSPCTSTVHSSIQLYNMCWESDVQRNSIRNHFCFTHYDFLITSVFLSLRFCFVGGFYLYLMNLFILPWVVKYERANGIYDKNWPHYFLGAAPCCTHSPQRVLLRVHTWH